MDKSAAYLRVNDLGYPQVCGPRLYKQGCMCAACRAHDEALVREEREQRIKEGLTHGQ